MHSDTSTLHRPSVYGLTAEFNTPEELLKAVRKTRLQGYRHYDAYSPFPVHGMEEEMGLGNSYVPLLVLIGGLSGAATGFGMQYISMVLHYPYIAGGKPYFSWPQFIPITFEMGILFAAFAAVFGMLALNRLPRPHHPIFSAKRSERISSDGFFLCIEADDPQFDIDDTRGFLHSLHPLEVAEVPLEERAAVSVEEITERISSS